MDVIPEHVMDTSTMTPGLRHWEPSAAVVFIADVRPAIAFCVFLFFYFDVIYFQDLVLFVPASLGLSPLFPSITGDCVECGQYFACPAIVWVPVALCRGLSPSWPHSVPGSGS
jgi:hypothetical protein